MNYTSEDFRRALASIIEADEAGEGTRPDSRVLAALRIAANVAEPGMIASAMLRGMSVVGAGRDEIEAAIRAALQKDTSHG